ncbi:hypothetical protein LJB81_02235 [Desulfovibrio sp. OttesenSCG-928-M14]|nr:hypothetical protein [Desulfovibrio sp. OttesenSCG-928-M14]
MYSRQALVLLSLLLILSLLLPTCTGKRYPTKDSNIAASDAKKDKPGATAATDKPDPDPHMSMPRADPGYLQHLERFSMLAKSREMAQVVSGSELAWRSPGSSGASNAMLGFADTWLLVNPMTLLTSTRSPAFSQLSESSIWPIFREVGVKGLYVAPVLGGGALWAKDRSGIDSGEDVVQYEFARAAGEEAQYKGMMRGVIDNHGLLGSDLVPSATGLGPDFFLAARNVRDFPGIYCMVEVPNDQWANLPAASSEWDCKALNSSQVAALHKAGLLPKAMRDEKQPFSRPAGWAATGVVRGIDGNNYRWVYRYHGSPEFAVLNWDDPSQAAHRILSGSAVRQVGLQGQALLGLRFEAFQGLDPSPDTLSSSASYSLEPARTAASSMGREIRRYGGWSWVRDDNLPLSGLSGFLSSGTDFITDSAFSPGAEHALLTGDADLLRYMADESLRLNIDGRRLVHVMPAQDGINYSLPHISLLASSSDKAASFRQSVLGAMRQAASRAPASLFKGDRLYATGPALAALALNAASAADAQSRESQIAAGHSLLIFFKAMQPGLMMLTGQDLVGALPLQWGGFGASADPAVSARGAYGLTASALARPASLAGVPKTPTLYGPADVQVHKKDAFLQRIGSFLRARTSCGIARGTLAARPETKGKGSIALLSRLPDGQGWLLNVCNFSREQVTESISLAGVQGFSASATKAIRTGGKYSVDGRNVTVSLGPWQGLAIVFGGRGGGNDQAAGNDEAATPIPDSN